MIKIVIWINNQLWERQQEKRKENSWKNQQEWNKNKKKNWEQSINWKYINNWKTNIFKNDYQKKELCFHCEKKRYQVKKCRNLQQEKSTEIQTQITTTKKVCKKKWCQNMKCWQHHSRQNIIKNQLWLNKKTEWKSSVQIWNKNDSWHQKHDKLHWIICYENDCITHLSKKKEKYFLKASKNYREKKKTRWAIWNIEKAKISHQVNKFSEKFDDKSRFLEIEQKEKQIK